MTLAARMGRVLGVVLAVVVMASSAFALEVAKGRQSFIKTDEPISRISVGDGEVADVAIIDDTRIRVLGLRPGRTDLVVWFGENEETKTFILNVTADIGGMRWQIDQTPELAGARVIADGARVTLSGTVPGMEAHAMLTQLANLYLGDGNYGDTVRVAGERMVSVEVKVAAVSVTTLRALGFNFQRLGEYMNTAIVGPSEISAGTLASAFAGAPPIFDAFNLLFGGTKGNVGAILSAISGTEMAQLLAEPTLMVRSGEEANFLVGGEVPIPVPKGDDKVAIEYKPFGVRLNVAPTVMANGVVSMRLTPEVSELDFANAIQLSGFTVPAFRTRQASTTVELPSGSSLVLAGLQFSTNDARDSKIPGLGDIPILGAFFKRTESEREKQELIIVATPRLIQPINGDDLPPLPGEEINAYSPTTFDMLLNRNRLEDAAAQHGLLP